VFQWCLLPRHTVPQLHLRQPHPYRLRLPHMHAVAILVALVALLFLASATVRRGALRLGSKQPCVRQGWLSAGLMHWNAHKGVYIQDTSPTSRYCKWKSDTLSNDELFIGHHVLFNSNRRVENKKVQTHYDLQVWMEK
jgi:hypothetical protein